MGFGQQLDLGKKIVAHLGPRFLVRLLFAPAANGGIRMFPPAGSQFFPCDPLKLLHQPKWWLCDTGKKRKLLGWSLYC
jgi:hypothetical protein